MSNYTENYNFELPAVDDNYKISKYNTTLTSIDAILAQKQDKVAGKGLSTNDFTTEYKNKLDGIEEQANKTIIDTELSDSSTNPVQNRKVKQAMDTKVDKVTGKGLSTEDYTSAEKTKLSGIETGAEVNVVETVKVNGTAQTVTDKAVNITVPTKASDLTDDSGHYTKPSGGIPKTDLAEALKQEIEGKEDNSNKVTELTSESTNTQYPGAKAVYDELVSVKAENAKLQTQVTTLKEITNQMPQVSDDGYEAYLADTIEAPFEQFEVKGHSEQETTEGKQLIGIADGTYTSTNNAGSITFKDGIGKVTIASGTSSSFGMSIPLIKPVILKANQSYTRCNNNGNAYPYITLYDSEKATIDSMLASDNGLKVYTPTEDKEVHYIFLWFSIQSYGDIKPMMAEGSYTASTMPDFEKFTYGASPNPSYEQPVKSCGENTLPNEYQQVEYIESSGTQYIDTGCIVDVNTKIIFKGGQSTTSGAFFGLRATNDANRFYLASGQQKVSLYYSYNKYINSIVSTGGINKGKITSTIFRLNDNLVGSYTISSFPNLSLYLFALNQAGIATAFSSSKIYEFKIIKNNNLIRNFIPCYRKTDNVIGLYDLSNNEFYTNKGTGAFVKGQDITGELAINLSIENNDDTEEQNISIPVQAPFRSIGDVEDEFVKKNDGKWYERHYSPLIDLADLEWEYRNTNTDTGISTYRFDLTNRKAGNNIKTPRCTHFQYLGFQNAEINVFPLGEGIVFYYNDNLPSRTTIYLNSTISTLSELITWLTNNNVKLQYEAIEPTDLLCTQAQSDILDSLTEDTITYRGGTYISSPDEVKARIKVSGLKDLNVMFEDLTNAIISQGANA